jgi:PKD repeat protein
MLILFLLSFYGAFAALEAHAADGLKVIIVDGDEAANIVAEKIAAEPVIEVRDRDNRRVPNAVVRFLIRKTARNRLAAVFRNGQPEIRTLTDQAGRASADVVTPLEPGSFDVEVQVSYRGETAKATIHQTNYATTADAKAAGREPAKSTSQAAQTASAASEIAPAAGSAAIATAGGGVSKLAVIGLVAGGAAGAGAAVVLSKKESPAPPGLVNAVTASVTSGLQTATPFTFSAQTTGFDAASTTYSWNFGDGSTSTDPTPTHVYAAPGSYTVAVTVTDARRSASSQLSVTVHTLTGTWSSPGAQTTLRLTQSGITFTGSAAVGVDWPDCPVSGTAQSSSPAIVLVQPPCRSPNPLIGPLLVPLEYRLDLSPDGQTLSGTRVRTVTNGTSDQIVFRR